MNEITLHIVTVRDDGLNVAIGRTFEAAALQFAADVPREDANGAYAASVSIEPEHAAEWVRFMLGAYSRQHAERVVVGLGL